MRSLAVDVDRITTNKCVFIRAENFYLIAEKKTIRLSIKKNEKKEHLK